MDAPKQGTGNALDLRETNGKDPSHSKHEVLRFIDENPDKPLKEVAETFGVSEKSIRAWKAHKSRGTYGDTGSVCRGDAKDRARASKPISEKRANDLDGKTWLKHSISIWSDIRKSKEEARLDHPAMFPIQLPKRLIEAFTNKSMKVILDPFLGSGATLIAAMEMNKEGVGFEISSEYVKISEERVKRQNLFSANIPPKIYHDDALNLLSYLPGESVDLCITSPPYWDILSEKRSADYKQTRDYDEQRNNLSAIKSYEEFLEQLAQIFQKVFIALKPRRYCCVNVMDLRKKDRFYPFHSDLAKKMQTIGFIFDDLIIWDRRQEYNNLRPLGYPFVFRINKIHEYILIFKKA